MVTTKKQLNQNTGFLSKYITYSNCLILVFFVLSFIGIVHHEMWRDETQAWLLARDSSTLIDLYQNLKYEGHPGLWHLCLFLITKFTDNPFAMQFFHILISTAAVYIFVKLSPFNILHKTLFTFGYFPLFEYNLISRNYNLGLLITFIFCYLFTRKKRNYILLSLALALLANVNVYCLIISFCLSVSLIIDVIRINKIHQYKLNRKQTKNLTIGLLIIVLGIGLSVFQLLPVAIQDTAKDIQQNIGEETVISRFDFLVIMLRRFGFSVRSISLSYVPIPDFFRYHFWGYSITYLSKYLALLSFCISLLLLFYSTFLFVEKPIVLFFYLSSTIGIMLFSFLKFQGTIRHHGNLFIVFLACIWISKYFGKSYNIAKPFQTSLNYAKKYYKSIITIILLIQMLSGIYAYSMDLIYPFSRSKVAAEFIQKEELDNSLIMADKNTVVSPISAYINQNIYYLAYNKFGSFFENPQTKFIKSQSELLDKINDVIENSTRKNILILSYPLELKSSELRFRKLKQFENSIVGEERYYIYLVEKNRDSLSKRSASETSQKESGKRANKGWGIGAKQIILANSCY